METYNGWSSRATWLVNLWIDNDPGDYEYWRDRAREVCEDPEVVARYEWETDKQAAIHALAGELEDRIDAYIHEQTGDWGMITDLMSVALAEVDWREIAEHWVEDVWEGPDNREVKEDDTDARG